MDNKDKKSCPNCEVRKDGSLICKKTKSRCSITHCPYNQYSDYR